MAPSGLSQRRHALLRATRTASTAMMTGGKKGLIEQPTPASSPAKTASCRCTGAPDIRLAATKSTADRITKTRSRSPKFAPGGRGGRTAATIRRAGLVAWGVRRGPCVEAPAHDHRSDSREGDEEPVHHVHGNAESMAEEHEGR